MCFYVKVLKLLWASFVAKGLLDLDAPTVEGEEEAEPVVAEGLTPVNFRGHVLPQLFREYSPCHFVDDHEGVVRVPEAGID